MRIEERPIGDGGRRALVTYWSSPATGIDFTLLAANCRTPGAVSYLRHIETASARPVAPGTESFFGIEVDAGERGDIVIAEVRAALAP